MNILSLLAKEKRVAGIEISDSVVRIAFFRSHKMNLSENISDDAQNEELVLVEEPIASNIIADGVVIDENLLGKTLKSIWEKANLETNYAIVAIPDDKIYSRIFLFPKSVDGERLNEAVQLAIDFQIPIKTEDAYLDWERTQGTATLNEILLSTIPKEVAQKYITALEFAGIKILALESHLASIARAVELTPGEITLYSKKTPDGATIFALQDGILRFSRTLPLRFVPEDKIPSEVKKVKSALETDNKKEVHEEDIVNAKIRPDYALRPELSEPKSKWLVALGAAIRGKIPGGKDDLVSLLPVGTEEAYSYQKTAEFINLLRNITVGVSIFFVLAFLSAYLFVFSLSQSANGTVSSLSATPVSPELLAKETSIEHLNEVTSTSASILADTPQWSVLFEGIASTTIDGITVSGFSAPAISGKISLTGTARDRSTLNQFKKTLQSSKMFTEIDIPTTNLEQKGDIPFSTTFRVADPSTVYYK